MAVVGPVVIAMTPVAIAPIPTTPIPTTPIPMTPIAIELVRTKGPTECVSGTRFSPEDPGRIGHLGRHIDVRMI